MKKKLLILLFSLFLMTLVTGCTTTEERVVVAPFTASVSFPAEGTYEILGRVDFVASKGNAGFAAFLEHAKSVYPLTDDVVNIIVDTESTYEVTKDQMKMTTSSTLISSVYSMSGIAIKFVE